MSELKKKLWTVALLPRRCSMRPLVGVRHNKRTSGFHFIISVTFVEFQVVKKKSTLTDIIKIDDIAIQIAKKM